MNGISLKETLDKEKNNYAYASLGASGAVSGVVFSSVLFQPWSTIGLFFIPIPGIIAAIGYIGYSIYMSKKNVGNINHDAHLWGTIFGIVFTIVLDFDILHHFFDQLSNTPF